MPSSNVERARAARWAIGLAAGAVLLGHGLTYSLVQPDTHARAGFLASTGHAYLHLLEGPGLVLAVGSVLAAAALGLRGAGLASDRTALFRRLATIQVAAFAAMEVAERIGSGSLGRAGMVDAAVVAVGIAAQLALAYAGAWLLDVARRGGRRLADAIARPRSAFARPSIVVAPAGDVAVTSLATAAPPPGRGPPRRRP